MLKILWSSLPLLSELLIDILMNISIIILSPITQIIVSMHVCNRDGERLIFDILLLLLIIIELLVNLHYLIVLLIHMWIITSHMLRCRVCFNLHFLS